MEWVKESKRYIDFIEKQKGYSPLTMKSYLSTFEEASSFIHVETQGEEIFFDASFYRLSLAHQGKRTIARKMSALRSLVAFWRSEGKKVRAKGVESMKVPTLLPKPVASQEIQEALMGADEDLRVVMSVMYTAGLRISEVCDLTVSDLKEGWLRVYGKGGKERQIPLLPWVFDLLKERSSYKEGDEPLFYDKSGKLSQNSLRYRINKIFDQRGLHVTPHQLRHSFATDLLNAGARINDVSELLGHKHLSTTQVYTKISRSKKIEEYQASHPMCQGI